MMRAMVASCPIRSRRFRDGAPRPRGLAASYCPIRTLVFPMTMSTTHSRATKACRTKYLSPWLENKRGEEETLVVDFSWSELCVSVIRVVHHATSDCAGKLKRGSFRAIFALLERLSLLCGRSKCTHVGRTWFPSLVCTAENNANCNVNKRRG